AFDMVELIWDGKYDVDGRRAAPPRVALPFQTVETINESTQERQRSLDLFSTGRDPEWRNRLIWGDKKYVLPALVNEFAGQVDHEGGQHVLLVAPDETVPPLRNAPRA